MTNGWSDFLNPDVVRARFLRAGLFLIAHEMLMSAVNDRLHEFFSDSWSAADGWKVGPKYKEKVLSLDPKGKNDPFRASIQWLIQMNVIDERDEKSIRKLTEERNRLAHELRDVVGGSHQHDFENLFPQLMALVAKIDRWWIINVEIATDPDMVDKEIDEEGVTPGSILLLQILEKVALGKDEDAWALFREFSSSQNSN